VESLKKLCDSHLIKSVNCENALAVAALAQRHGLEQATKDIRQFIARFAADSSLTISVICNQA